MAFPAVYSVLSLLGKRLCEVRNRTMPTADELQPVKSENESVANQDQAGQVADQNRRSEEDRRSPVERRRSARGLFEVRARRSHGITDRRQTERRSSLRSLFGFLRSRST